MRRGNRTSGRAAWAIAMLCGSTGTIVIAQAPQSERELPERVIVREGLAMLRGRVLSLDEREVRVQRVEVDTLGLVAQLEDELLREDGASVQGGRVVRIPRSEVLAILPVSGGIVEGVWGYARGGNVGDVTQTPEQRERRQRLTFQEALRSRMQEMLSRRGANGQPEEAATTRSRGGVLRTADGQVLDGSLLVMGDIGGQAAADAGAGAAGEDVLLWASSVLGTEDASLVVPLDVVAGIELDDSRGLPASSDGQDVVRLSNGDELRGFVSTRYANGVLGMTVEPLGADAARAQTVHVSLDRVVALALGTTPTAVDNATRIWVGDSVLRVRHLMIEGHETSGAWAGFAGSAGVASEGEGEAIGVPTSLVRAASLAPGRVASLAGFAMTTVNCAVGRRWCPPAVVDRDAKDAPLGVSRIELPGPMEVSFATGPVLGVAGTIALPERCRGLGDCEVVVLSTDAVGMRREVARERLDGARPEAMVSVRFAPGTTGIAVRVEGGASPVQDRVVLSGMIVERSRVSDSEAR